ncbi:MAG TPA: efflux RND transporter periplasmic adaptor subunit [Bryobacteraceae bacterium]|nr:efflux RND transporter periplasmic adaptor subunit [Bryobacteraceae bacterium]
MCLVACGGSSDKAGKGEGQKGRSGPAVAVPVVVEDVRRQPVPLEIRAIGNVEAFSAVEIKPRISGPILQVHIQEGADVRAGQLLFTIDPRDYQQAVLEAESVVAAQKAALGQAEANYERDVANAANAKTQADRFASLAVKGIVSQQENERYRTEALAAEKAALASKATIESARAAVKGAEAKLADARLQQSYTAVRAPIGGRTGSLAFKTGDLVTANSEPPLLVINQIVPTYVTFSIPEQSLAELRRHSADGRLKVHATPQGGAENTTAEGTLNFLDNRIDPGTGTILVKARFANTDRRLWPGQFVNVSVQLSVPVETVVPTAAVRTAQNGRYVFVVKPDMTVEQRPIQTPRATEQLTVVSEGLSSGDQVIVEGQLRVRPGGKVQIVRRTQPGQNQSDGAAEGTRARVEPARAQK